MKLNDKLTSHLLGKMYCSTHQAVLSLVVVYSFLNVFLLLNSKGKFLTWEY